MSDNNWVQQERAAKDRERLFEALVAYVEENGFSPTRKELAELTSLAEITVRRGIKALREEGRVSERGHRTLRPII